jgi:uncharacterized protein YjbJ (UPF0337 family)
MQTESDELECQEDSMADEGKGKAEHLGGKIKEGAGDLLGDRKMKREGQLKQAKGEAEQDEARARDEAEEARERKLNAEIEEKRTDR